MKCAFVVSVLFFSGLMFFFEAGCKKYFWTDHLIGSILVKFWSDFLKRRPLCGFWWNRAPGCCEVSIGNLCSCMKKRFTGILLLAVFLPFCRGHQISNNAYRCKFFPGFPLCFSVHCLGWCHSSFFPESHSASLCWSQREARNVDAWDWSQKMGGRCQRESEQTVRMIYPKKSRIVHGGKPKLMVYYHPSLASSVVTRMIAGNPKKTQPPPWSSNQPTFFADFSPRNAFGSETMNVPSLTS